MTDTLSEPDGGPRHVLAIDSATASCSAAVLVDGRVAGHWRHDAARGHAEVLLPGILEAAASAGVTIDAFDLIGVTVGPGSFTGLRVGIAAARGLALATGAPVVGVSTFEAIAAAVSAEAAGRNLCVLVDSRRGDLFAQFFSAGELSAPRDPELATPAQLAALLPAGPLLIAGDGIAVAEQAEPGLFAGREALKRPGGSDAAAAARVALARRAGSLPPLAPRPLYLRQPEAKLPVAG